MYAHIDGILAEKTPESVVIDCNGVGYFLMVSGGTLSQAPSVGEPFKLYTVLSVREDAMDLFGFYSREEKAMYEKLRSVSGIGPRTALGILSSLSVRDLSIALVAGDANALARAPGVGKKTAQRLVLELRDKVDNEELTGFSAPLAPGSGAGMAGGATGEAIEALMALGYASSEAARAVSKAATQTDDAKEMIRLALRGMNS